MRCRVEREGDTTYLDMMDGFAAPHGPGQVYAPARFDRESISLTMLPDGRRAYLNHSLTFIDSTGAHYTALVRMLTDGRSGPVVARPPFRTKFLRAYVIHDHRCYLAQMLPPGPLRDAVRLSGDRQLGYETLPVLCAKPCVAWVIYRAVRIGAWTSRHAPRLNVYPVYVGKD